MHAAETGTVVRRQAPVPGGPNVGLLVAPGISEQMAVVHVQIPAGGGMPDHDHGDSEIVLIPVSGAVELRHDGVTRTLTPGSAAHIAIGERVALANTGTEPASLMVVASPPRFAEALALWPAV